MRTLTATIATIATIAAIAGLVGSSAFAVEISDNDLKLAPVIYLQTRAEISDAKDSAGDDYSLEANGAGKSDTVDFYIRRFRPGFKGTYQSDWRFAMIWRLDDTLRAGGTATSATIHQGYIAREFKNDDVTHVIKTGLDYAFFSHAESSNNLSMWPIQRASQNLFAVRGAGISYFLNTHQVRWGVDIMNNLADDATAQSPSATLDPEGEGLSYTTRVEVTGPGDWAIPKFQESWFGKDGQQWMAGAEVGFNQRDRYAVGGVGYSADTVVFGLDGILHWDRWSALVEGRWLTRSYDVDDGSDQDDLKQVTYAAQVGYAIPVSWAVLEPCVRAQLIDFDADEDSEAVNYAVSADAARAISAVTNKDYGNSGEQFDLGVNAYFNGHANKLSLVYTHWDAEDGDAQADILRLQHQIAF
jgi:hypothetical protein